jgi:hypothetical protein
MWRGGRLIYITKLTISRERGVVGAQVSPRRVYPPVFNAKGRKVDKNELTISLPRVCCGSSGISWVSLSTRVWLMRRGGRLIKMSLPSAFHGCAVAAQASPG